MAALAAAAAMAMAAARSGCSLSARSLTPSDRTRTLRTCVAPASPLRPPLLPPPSSLLPSPSAQEPVVAWGLDAISFKSILMGKSQTDAEDYKNFIKQVPILKVSSAHASSPHASSPHASHDFTANPIAKSHSRPSISLALIGRPRLLRLRLLLLTSRRVILARPLLLYPVPVPRAAQDLSPDSVQEMAGCLKEVEFPTDANIICEGDEGNNFYIIREGEVKCTKAGMGEVSRKLTRGDFFGELALLSSDKRAATVTATKATTVLSLKRDEFTRLLGPLKDLISETAAASRS